MNTPPIDAEILQAARDIRALWLLAPVSNTSAWDMAVLRLVRALYARDKLTPEPAETPEPHSLQRLVRRSELDARITQYLCVGGSWNPELMEHDKVRDLLMSVREYLRYPRSEARL